ncbi:hypothetical protein, partial [Enterocloster clostridioformis]|uniref:hypothetical protein n=1 Tax=Enterocloster clostridioformis TaxID=1531 RepID=UPI0040639C38
LIEPPCTEPYARWCERSKFLRKQKFLLLDCGMHRYEGHRYEGRRCEERRYEEHRAGASALHTFYRNYTIS